MPGAELQFAGDARAGRKLAANNPVQQFVGHNADQRFPSQFSPSSDLLPDGVLRDGQVYLRVVVPYATLAFICKMSDILHFVPAAARGEPQFSTDRSTHNG